MVRSRHLRQCTRAGLCLRSAGFSTSTWRPALAGPTWSAWRRTLRTYETEVVRLKEDTTYTW